MWKIIFLSIKITEYHKILKNVFKKLHILIA